MRAYRHLLLTVLVAIIATTTGWADLVITNLQSNGELSVTGVWTNAACRVEWASSLDGTWYRSWQTLDYEESETNTTMTFKVPMFYRVVISSNPPPAGMVLVDAGPFMMGDSGVSGGWLWATPKHVVDVPAFYMDRYEVSNARMAAVLNWAKGEGFAGWFRYSETNEIVRTLEGSTRVILRMSQQPACRISYNIGDEQFVVDPGAENLPCVGVTWHGALAFCNYRSDMEGLERAINSISYTVDRTKEGYRLPSESEWEKAARGGRTDHFYPWASRGGAYSNHINGSMANFRGSGDPMDGAGDLGVTPVGYYNGSQQVTNALGELLSAVDMANGYGLYDMAGNVAEYCLDQPDTNYVGAPTDGSANNGAEGNHRIVRGGSFSSRPVGLLCSDREDVLYDAFPYEQQRDFGFRCVRNAP